MAKMIKKTYYYDSVEAKKVERLAKKLKVTESQIVRWQSQENNFDSWLSALKIKQNVNH